MFSESHHVFIWKSEESDYKPISVVPPLELPGDTSMTTPLLLLRSLLLEARLDLPRYGTAEWNPLGDLIKPGDKVVLKPNWVLDRNLRSGGTIECLVTHTSVIEAVLHYVVKARPESIIVGDAPIQACDFEHLRKECGLDDMLARFNRLGYDIQIHDFRLTKMKGLFRDKIKTEPDPKSYCLFDLGKTSWLAPITEAQTEFRVINYDQNILKKHHNQRTHQYLIAREIIDANVVINLPKLKTHKKAGVTGALKNMVGINGFKEYLPHHRKGGSLRGGDCYQGDSWLKRFAEDSLDRANIDKACIFRYLHTKVAALTLRLGSLLFRQDRNLEGSWYGNDTVWRMCLDLQRILHFGNGYGRICDSIQRKVITITDAIIAGEGNGPLASTPVPLGIMTFGTNVAALEWVHCLLMCMHPDSIPLVIHAFAENDWPLANFLPKHIVVHINGEILPDLESLAKFSRRFSTPAGWKGHCEKTDW